MLQHDGDGLVVELISSVGLGEVVLAAQALDKRRDSVLEKLEQDRRYARTILPSRTVIVDGKKMCLVPDNDGQWQATASRAKPQTTEVTVDGQRKCLTKSGPATWREVSCPK